MRRLFLLFCLSLIPVGASAGTLEWTPGGPHGGGVTVIVIAPSEPDVVFAGTREGHVFRSSNAGDSWELVGFNVDGAPVERIFVSPFDANRVFVKTPNGLYRSSNRGFTFLPRLERFDAVAMHPWDPSILIAGTDLRSMDAGITWQPAQGAGFADTRAIAFDPVDASVVYAAGAVGSGGIVLARSNDGGQTWIELPRETRNSLDWISRITTHPERSGTVFASNDWLTLRSEDYGQTWNSYLYAREVAAAGTSVYAAASDGLSFSHDDGATYVKSSSLPALTVAIDPRNADVVYAGLAREGILKSTDGGRTWSPRNEGLVATAISEVAASIADPNVVYAASHDVVYRSNDRGRSWLRVARLPGEYSNGYVSALAVDPRNAEVVFATVLNELRRSSDGGATWETVRKFTTVNAITSGLSSIAIDPKHPETLFVTSFGDSFYSQNGVIFRSTDGGASFEAVGNKQYYLYEVEIDDAALYAAGSNGIERSTDGGATWAFVSQFPQSNPIAIWADPRSDSVFAVTQAGGALRSDDSGATWREISEGLPPSTSGELPGQAITGVRIGGELHLVLSRKHYRFHVGQLFVSDDGTTWHAVDLEDDAAFALAATREEDGTVFAGTLGRGVFFAGR